METKKADVEKREEERRKAKKQREAKKKRSDWLGKIEVMASEWKDFIEDNQFMSIGAVMAMLLLAVLVVIGIPEQPTIVPLRQRQIPSTGNASAQKKDTTGSEKKTPRSNGKKHD